MRFLIRSVVALAFLMVVDIDVRGQTASGSLQPFRGSYQITGGLRGTVRVSEALGGSYTEWAVSFGQPSHELRMLVGSPNNDGTFRVWRFEQQPAPAVLNEGTARLQGQELIADFAHAQGPNGKMIRERWRLTNGGLGFVLEASGQGEPPNRVGGFTAIRE